MKGANKEWIFFSGKVSGRPVKKIICNAMMRRPDVDMKIKEIVLESPDNKITKTRFCFGVYTCFFFLYFVFVCFEKGLNSQCFFVHKIFLVILFVKSSKQFNQDVAKTLCPSDSRINENHFFFLSFFFSNKFFEQKFYFCFRPKKDSI